jgi:SPP1 family predicted phage head-tail adaptor
VAVRSGDLNRQVTLQQRSVGRDTFGQELVDWTTVATPMACIKPLSGRELEMAKAMNAETTHSVEIRYRSNINTAMRLVYQGRNFNIHSIIDLEMRHEVLQLSCGEGLDGG